MSEVKEKQKKTGQTPRDTVLLRVPTPLAESVKTISDLYRKQYKVVKRLRTLNLLDE